VRADSRSQFVRFGVPEAVRNVLGITLPEGIRLVAHPGVRGPDGDFHFASADSLEVRFAPADAPGAAPVERKRLSAVDTPPVVLDTLYCFTSFTEGGGALTVLALDVPVEAGAWLKVKRVPQAEIWSLKINGSRESLYAEKEGDWMVPLAGGRRSRVELAFLQKGEALGLRGRLESRLPATGIPARKLFFGVGLPDRVDLISVEGNLTPAAGDSWPVPPEFVGKRHFFSRAFYNGEGMKAAFFYKEPFEANAGGAQ
jgi:hypothetical protein